MKTIFLIGIAALAGSTFSNAALASTDYQCLNACVNGGTPSAQCLSRCSYGTPASKPSTAASIDPHHVFKAPVPLGNEVFLKKPKPQMPQTPTKDYVCMSACLQQTVSYGMCEQQCSLAPQNFNTNRR